MRTAAIVRCLLVGFYLWSMSSIKAQPPKHNHLYFEIGTALHLPVLSLRGSWFNDFNYNQFPLSNFAVITRRLDLNVGGAYLFSKPKIETSNYSRIGYTRLLGAEESLLFPTFPKYTERYIAFDNTTAVNKFAKLSKKKNKDFYFGSSFSWHNLGRTYLTIVNRYLPRNQWTFELRSLQHNSVASQFGLELGKPGKLLDNMYLEFRTEYIYNLYDGSTNRKYNFLRFGVRFYKKLEIHVRK